jgi:hypothetical protein
MERKTNLIGYPIVIIITAILTFLVSTCDSPTVIVDQGPYPPDGPPEEVLSFGEIIKFYENYTELESLIEDHTRRRISDSTFIAPRSVSFDYQELKNYLAFIEKNAEDAKIKISSLRFHFGKYNNVNDKNKAYRQTLFYNPTFKYKVQGKTLELSYAIQRNGDKISAVPLQEVLDSIIGPQKRVQKSINKASVLSFSFNNTIYYGAESQAGNRGQINPPPKSSSIQ